MAEPDFETLRTCAKMVGVRIEAERRTAFGGFQSHSVRYSVYGMAAGLLQRGSLNLVNDWFWRTYGSKVRSKIELMIPPSADSEFEDYQNFLANCAVPPQKEWPVIEELREANLETREDISRLKRTVERLTPGITEDRFWEEIERAERERKERRRQQSSDRMIQEINEAVDKHRNHTGQKVSEVGIEWRHNKDEFIKTNPFTYRIDYE